MTKDESNKILKKIKAYYYYMELDKDSLKIWIDKMLPYSYEDVDNRVEEHSLGEERQNPPKIQNLLKGLLTEEQKSKARTDYLIQCPLCKKWMTIREEENHYGRCLDIDYLVGVSKSLGLKFGREDLENYSDEVLNKLYEKYPPENIEYKPQKI